MHQCASERHPGALALREALCLPVGERADIEVADHRLDAGLDVVIGHAIEARVVRNVLAGRQVRIETRTMR